MLTVIITTDEANAFLREYQSLFYPFEQDGEIAICHWNRQGRDIRTALPELYNLVRTCTQWRALVVLPLESAEQEQEFPTRTGNPYDFLCSAEQTCAAVEESKIPLVRLTQMLGGVPEPVYEYADVVEDHGCGNKACRHTVLRTSEEEMQENRRRWLELEEKYAFNNEKPVELWLLKACRKNPLARQERAAEREKGHRPSQFVMRNRYPVRVRFMEMECTGPGHARARVDEMRFWMTALTLALNDYDSGRISADRLYRVECPLHEDELQQLLSDYCNRLERIGRDVVRRMDYLNKQREETRAPALPTYEMQVTVENPAIDAQGLYVSGTSLGLSSNCPAPELPWWRGKMVISRKSMTRVLLAPRRNLDRACAFCRRNARIEPVNVTRMDHYHIEELESLLNDEEIQIFNTEAFDALPVREFHRSRRQADRETSIEIGHRMPRKLTITAGCTALALYLAGFLPEIVRTAAAGQDIGPLLGLCGARLVGLAAVAVGTLLVFWGRLQYSIRGYNNVMRGIMAKISTSCNFFSDYLSRVCSYMRGRSINDVLCSRSLLMQEESTNLERHQHAMEKNCRRAASWLENFGMEVLPDEARGKAEYFNSEIPPEKNEIYDLHASHNGCAVDADGQRIRVPYPFVGAPDIKREELFE